MTKQQKIDYINQVNDRFREARNHGRNGSNWWYPTPNTIAYNVKLYGQKQGIEEIKELMTDRQKEYYSDDNLYDFINHWQNQEAEMFSNDLDLEYSVKSGYAGRSGGWLESVPSS